MEDKGKYVRIANDSDSEQQEPHSFVFGAFPDEESEHSNARDQQDEESGDSVTSDESDSSTSLCESSEADDKNGPEPTGENDTSPKIAEKKSSEIVEELDRMRKVIEDLTNKLNEYEKPGVVPRPIVEENWSVSQNSSDRVEGAQVAVRWDHIKPFPSGIPANKMWEEWNRFIENFDIAASLGNAVSSAQRSKLLFLCLGQELQGIVRAAKLKPSLAEPDCYSTFVNNIRGYLQSMTDTAAEHEAFAAMKQGSAESAIAYHARLQEKVRLCGYSPVDQERFVRAQLLEGLRNKDLTKSARIYNYDININKVQSATREEAYEAETNQPSGSDIAVVQRGNWKRPSELYRKRDRDSTRNSQFQPKRFRGPVRRVKERRGRCHLYNRPAHRSETTCPALEKTCNGCGKRRHFVAKCPKRRVNNEQRNADRATPPDCTDDEEEDKKVLKK